MDHFKKIYSHHAKKYHNLINVEDIDQNLLPALERLKPLARTKVLDLGSGTGRIPIMVCEHVHQVSSLDLHWAMLLEQQAQMDQALTRWGLLQGDMRRLPFPNKYYDVVTAGWAIGHFVGWFQDSWKFQIERVIREMIRVVKHGGMLYIIETMTTGSLVPSPPTPGLGEYYNLLENKWDFSCQLIRTDYLFQNLEEATSLVNFFFGEELAEKVNEKNWVRLPEWTGVWSRPT